MNNMAQHKPYYTGPRFGFERSGRGWQAWAYIPWGWSRKPQYHLEYMAESQGIKRVEYLFTLDTKMTGSIKSLRWQRQKKHYGTRWSRMVEK